MPPPTMASAGRAGAATTAACGGGAMQSRPLMDEQPAQLLMHRSEGVAKGVYGGGEELDTLRKIG